MCLNQIVRDDLRNADNNAEAFASAILNGTFSAIRKKPLTDPNQSELLGFMTVAKPL